MIDLFRPRLIFSLMVFQVVFFHLVYNLALVWNSVLVHHTLLQI